MQLLKSYVQFQPSTSKKHREMLESNSDCYGKDLLFVALLAFCVITFEPIMIQTCSAPQNDRLNFSFVKETKQLLKFCERYLCRWQKIGQKWSKNGYLFCSIFFLLQQASTFRSGALNLLTDARNDKILTPNFLEKINFNSYNSWNFLRQEILPP